MSQFDFAFTLFGLLLGLCLAEVFSGLGNAIRARARVSIGFLTPLLAAFVMIDLGSFWTIAWSYRSTISVTDLTVLAMLAFTGAYYLAAVLVFPELPEGRFDLDNHYWSNKRLVLAIITLLNLFNYAVDWSLSVSPFMQSTRGLITVVMFFALLMAAILSRGARTNAILLAALIASYPLSAIWGMLVQSSAALRV
jgi:hypothetical protein